MYFILETDKTEELEIERFKIAVRNLIQFNSGSISKEEIQILIDYEFIMNDDRFTLFGTNLEQIPCFKKTFTVGICAGIMTGLTHFLFTSRVKRSSDIAVASFAVTTLGFWVYCRYNWTKERLLTQKLNVAIHDMMLNEGVKKKIEE